MPTETLGEGGLPNIGLLHIKEAYYWTIILLTRPFLVDAVSSYAPSDVLTPSAGSETCVSSCSEKVLVHACVDSAIRTIELLRILLDHDDIPKRLPFVVNSILVSALVLGLAHFGNMNKMFHVDASLDLAHRLLGKFPYDAIARRNTTIVGHLLQACKTINEKRSKLDRDRDALLVGKLFGSIHEISAQSVPGRSKADSLSASSLSHLRGLGNTDQMQQTSAEQNRNDQRELHAQFGATFQTSYHHQNFAPEASLGNGEVDVMSDQFMDANRTFEVSGPSMPPLSPRTLWFGPYNEEFPLFSTIDTSTT